MKKIYIKSIGCEQRDLDAQLIINTLTKEGFSIQSKPSDCNFVILITCAVDKTNIKRSKTEIKKITQMINPAAEIIIGGCLPSVDPNLVSKLGVTKTFSPKNLESLKKILGLKIDFDTENYPTRSIFDRKINNNNDNNARYDYEDAKAGYKIKINEGCLGNCSYCAIKKATGKLKSYNPNIILAKLEKGIKAGEKKIMIMGGDTGAYGADINYPFYRLLEDVINMKGQFSIYIHDFNIRWLINDLDNYAELFKNKNANKIKIINFPIQSGSDNVLKNMHRFYRSDDILKALSQIRNISKKLIFGTHVIIGFPGETDNDFEETIQVLKKIKFDFISVFPYADLNNISKKTKLQKNNEKIMLERQERISKEFDGIIKNF